MTSLTRLSRQGFTLVELMVVVAIIGILASIAISNYQKYQARARQSEAKLMLAAMYNAEQSFFAAEGSYTACITLIGYELGTGTRRYYSTGFDSSASSSNAANLTCGPAGNTSCLDYKWNNAGTATLTCLVAQSWVDANARMTGGAIVDQASAAASANSGVHQRTFTAIAVGYPSSTAGIADWWSIDQDRNNTNITNGI